MADRSSAPVRIQVVSLSGAGFRADAEITIANVSVTGRSHFSPGCQQQWRDPADGNRMNPAEKTAAPHQRTPNPWLPVTTMEPHTIDMLISADDNPCAESH